MLSTLLVLAGEVAVRFLDPSVHLWGPVGAAAGTGRCTSDPRRTGSVEAPYGLAGAASSIHFYRHIHLVGRYPSPRPAGCNSRRPTARTGPGRNRSRRTAGCAGHCSLRAVCPEVALPGSIAVAGAVAGSCRTAVDMPWRADGERRRSHRRDYHKAG